jgi:hypothetical protein
MSDTQLVAVAKENGLDDTKVKGLLSSFAEPFEHAQTALEQAKGITVTSEDQTAEMEEARHARLELKDIRVGVEKTRKELKEQSLREGKAIDGMANIIKAMIVPAEEYLEKQEKFAENIAKERQARITAERLNTLLQYTDTPSLYSFESMDAEVFDKLILELKTAKEAREKAEKQVELDRIAQEKADKEEQERIRQENAKLKAEAEAKEKAMAEERAKADAERKKMEAEAEAKLNAERKARETVEQAEKQRQEAEARKKAEEEEQQRKALLAPDKDKLMAFADTLDKMEFPNVSNREAGKLVDETKDFLNRISKNLRTKASQL